MMAAEAERAIAFPTRKLRITFEVGWVLVVLSLFTILTLSQLKPQPFGRILRFLLDGVMVTMGLTVVSFAFILFIGLIGGLGRLSKIPLIYGIATLYVEIIRGIPLMVQLLYIWFALPQLMDIIGFKLKTISAFAGIGQWLIDLKLSPFAAAVMGLSICYGAYMSEIFRAGIESIPKGQMEAARSLGMSYFQAMRYVILPQAFRVILPPIGNEFVALLKDSSLVSVLAVSDLTRRGREYMARTFESLETWTMVALIYLFLTLFFSRLVRIMERRVEFEVK